MFLTVIMAIVRRHDVNEPRNSVALEFAAVQSDVRALFDWLSRLRVNANSTWRSGATITLKRPVWHFPVVCTTTPIESTQAIVPPIDSTLSHAPTGVRYAIRRTHTMSSSVTLSS